jgi:hypothetical protein
MDRWMMGRVAGAIPNLSAAGMVVPSLRVVLWMIPSPDRALGTCPALAVVVLRVAVAPSLEG